MGSKESNKLFYIKPKQTNKKLLGERDIKENEFGENKQPRKPLKKGSQVKYEYTPGLV